MDFESIEFETKKWNAIIIVLDLGGERRNAKYCATCNAQVQPNYCST